MGSDRDAFFKLLNHHLARGTNPAGDPGLDVERRGPWSNNDLAVEIRRKMNPDDEVGVTYRAIRHWRSGRSLPIRTILELRQIFFGRDKKSVAPAYAAMDQSFATAFEKAKAEAAANARKGNMNDRLQFALPIPSLHDLQAVFDFDFDSYDTVGSIDWGLFQGWWQAYSEGFLATYDGTRPVAVTGLFPVTESWCADFLARAKSESDLDPDTIREAVKAKSGYWYFSGISSSTDLSGLRSPLACLIGHTLLRWLLNNPDYPPDQRITVVAEGASKPGRELLRKFFDFQLVSPRTDENSEARYRKYVTINYVKRYLSNDALLRRCKDLGERIKRELG